jgi:PAS domain S-box-containing protein
MLSNRSLFARPIRYKIVLTSMMVLISFAWITWFVSYSVMRESLEAHLVSELSNTTEAVKNMVETSVRLAIRSNLRAVAESNREILTLLHARQQRGELTEAEAKKQATEILLSQSIGQTGYLYCINSQAIATVHPSLEVVGRDFSGQDFVAEQVRRKEGYLEYEWKNPGEKVSRAKALYMSFFSPWDWIVSVTAYRDEFAKLVNVDDFSQSVRSLKFGKSGYSFVMDLQGNLIVHPSLHGQNAFEVAISDGDQIISTMIREKRGQESYEWQNPGDAGPRKKIVVFDYLPEVGWIVASSAYLDDLYEPLNVIQERTIAAVIFCLLIGVMVSIQVSASITDPIRQLVSRLSKSPPDNGFHGRDEVDQLSDHFERFLAALELEARERVQVEQDLRSSQERYRAVMEAAPDPIMVLGLEGEVNYLNQAFKKVFGWTLNDFSADLARAFVPPEERVRSRRLLARLLKAEVLAEKESLRVTREGERLTVNTSGGVFRDSDGVIGGCVIILRDISEFKLLEREVIDADERDRIRIGQDLHDDLVPHLIGLEVMYKLLRRRMGDDIESAEKQAEKVQGVITGAIEKTRALSRGLSPVHLVEEGLEMGLRQLGEIEETVFGIPCTVEWEGSVSLDITTAVHVYRIVQEALNNAVKHASANQLLIKCTVVGDTATFEVADNGSGLKDSHAKRGMGLKIMAFRAQMIGGSVDVAGSSTGTLVRLTVRQES